VLAIPVQLAYAVDDVTEAARRWNASNGIGPFFVREHIAVTNVRVNGVASTFDHSSAYAQWGTLMIELICQHDDGADRIVGSNGIHHVAFFVDDFAPAAAELVASGLPETLYAETGTGMAFALYDARADQGHLVEIYERTASLSR